MSVDDESFRDAMQDVAPLEQRRVSHAKPVVEVTIGQRQRREAAAGTASDRVDPNFLTATEVAQVDPLAIISWKKDGVQDAVFRRLRLGQYEIEGELDLHGKNVEESRARVFEFLHLAQAKGWRSVLIAHGRGVRSETPARIKSFVAHWLVEHPEVNAFHSAERRHGGTGAVYVLVKKSPSEKDRNREQYGGKAAPDPEQPVR